MFNEGREGTIAKLRAKLERGIRNKTASRDGIASLRDQIARLEEKQGRVNRPQLATRHELAETADPSSGGD